MFGMFKNESEKRKPFEEMTKNEIRDEMKEVIDRSQEATTEINETLRKLEVSTPVAGIAFYVLWKRFTTREPELSESIKELIDPSYEEFIKAESKEEKPKEEKFERITLGEKKDGDTEYEVKVDMQICNELVEQAMNRLAKETRDPFEMVCVLKILVGQFTSNVVYNIMENEGTEKISTITGVCAEIGQITEKLMSLPKISRVVKSQGGH